MSDLFFIRQLDVIIQGLMADLRIDFFEEFVDHSDKVVDLSNTSLHEMMEVIPVVHWTDKMHMIYGQLRAYHQMYELISSRLEGTKPLSLE